MFRLVDTSHSQTKSPPAASVVPSGENATEGDLEGAESRPEQHGRPPVPPVPSGHVGHRIEIFYGCIHFRLLHVLTAGSINATFNPPP